MATRTLHALTLPALKITALFACCRPQAWQPDGEGWLATAGKDGRLFVYDVESKLPMKEGMPFICQPGAIGLTDGECYCLPSPTSIL